MHADRNDNRARNCRRESITESLARDDTLDRGVKGKEGSEAGREIRSRAGVTRGGGGTGARVPTENHSPLPSEMIVLRIPRER